MTLRQLMVAALLVLGFVMPVQAQEYEKPFRAGLEARDKNWKEVERQMREAIRLNPRESPNKIRTGFGSITRVGGTEYVPYFFLGEALFHQDDCAGAVEAWSRSEQQNVVQKIDRYRQLQSGLDACEKKGYLRSPRFEEAVGAAQRELSAVTTAFETAQADGVSAGEALTPERQSQLDSATGLIRQAYAHFDAGRRTRAGAEFAQVTIATRQASILIVTFQKELGNAVLTRQSRLAAVDRDIALATDLDRTIELHKSQLTDSLTAARQSGRDLLARARRLSETTRNGTAAGAVSEVEALAGAARDKLQQVLNDTLEIDRKERVARTDKDLRAVRQRLIVIDKGFKDFDAAVRPSSDRTLTDERKAIEKRYRATVVTLETAGKKGDAAGIESARKSSEQIAVDLARLLQTLGVKPMIPDALARGVERFLTGDPAGALDALSSDDVVPRDEPLLAHVYMFRAAARYALYLKSKSTDATQLTEARAAIAALSALNSSLDPDRRVFPPRFIEFVRATRRELTDATSRP